MSKKRNRTRNRFKPRPPCNKDCEFYEDGECLIQMDMTYCGKDCAFATDNPGSTPPYGSKYMRGGKL